MHAPCYAQGGTTRGRPGASVEGDCGRVGRNAGQRMQRLIAMRKNACFHIGRGVRGGCERSRQTEGQPGVSQREVLRDVCRAAESRWEAPAWSGSFGSNACGSSCEPRVAAEYGGPRQCLRGKLRLCSAVGRGRLRRRAGAALQRHGDQHQPTRACRRCAPEVDTSLVDGSVSRASIPKRFAHSHCSGEAGSRIGWRLTACAAAPSSIAD